MTRENELEARVRRVEHLVTNMSADIAGVREMLYNLNQHAGKHPISVQETPDADYPGGGMVRIEMSRSDALLLMNFLESWKNTFLRSDQPPNVVMGRLFAAFGGMVP